MNDKLKNNKWPVLLQVWNGFGPIPKVLIWPKKKLFQLFDPSSSPKHFGFGKIEGLEIRMLLQKWVQPILLKDQDVNSWPPRLTTYDMFITAHYYTWQWQKIKWFWNFKYLWSIFDHEACPQGSLTWQRSSYKLLENCAL